MQDEFITAIGRIHRNPERKTVAAEQKGRIQLKELNQIGDYLTLGIQIALNMVVPVLIGIYADRYFDSSPWGVLIGAALGFGAVFTTLIKIALQANKENDRKKHKK